MSTNEREGGIRVKRCCPRWLRKERLERCLTCYKGTDLIDPQRVKPASDLLVAPYLASPYKYMVWVPTKHVAAGNTF